MRRSITSLTLLLFALGVFAACSAGDGSADVSDPPPLAQASSTATTPAPADTHTPDTRAIPVCPLLTSAEVATALAMNPAPTATEEQPAAAARSCRYQSGNRYLQLFVAVEPATGTAEAALNQVVRRYSGTLEEVPDLGDAAYYTGDATVQSLTTVRMEGTQMRTITMIGFLGGMYRDQLIGLARTALERS